MDRVVLLALLGIPILVAIHIAVLTFPTVDEAAYRLRSHASWPSPHQTIPTYFVIEQTAKRRA